MAQAYCVKCRAKRDIKNPRNVTLNNGKTAIQGVCPVCGTKVFHIGKGAPMDEKASAAYYLNG